MDLNVSVWGFLTWLAYYVIASFFMRFVSSKYPDSTIGKAVAYLSA